MDLCPDRPISGLVKKRRPRPPSIEFCLLGDGTSVQRSPRAVNAFTLFQRARNIVILWLLRRQRSLHCFVSGSAGIITLDSTCLSRAIRKHCFKVNEVPSASMSGVKLWPYLSTGIVKTKIGFGHCDLLKAPTLRRASPYFNLYS